MARVITVAMVIIMAARAAEVKTPSSEGVTRLKPTETESRS